MPRQGPVKPQACLSYPSILKQMKVLLCLHIPFLVPHEFWTDRCSALVSTPHGRVWTQFLSAVFWNLVADVPGELVLKLRVLYDAMVDKLGHESNLKHDILTLQILMFVGACLGILEARAAYVAGEKRHRLAHITLKPFSPLEKLALKREGALYSEHGMLCLVSLLVLQAESFLNKKPPPDLAYLYQVSKGINNYIGRTSAHRKSRVFGSAVHRGKEHLVAYWKHKYGTVAKKQIRSRYWLLLKNGGNIYPTMVVFSKVSASRCKELEAANISLSQPSCNQLQSTLGVKLVGGGSSKGGWYRMIHDRFRMTSRFKLAKKIVFDNAFCDAGKSEHLRLSQITSCMIHFQKCELEADKINEAKAILQQPFSLAYWNMRSMLGRRLGPVDIFTCDWTLLRYASIKPDNTPWERFFYPFGKSLDFLYELFSKSTNIPNHHVRVKSQTSIARFGHSFGLSFAKIAPIVVSCSSFVTPVRKWVNQSLDTYSAFWPFWCEYFKTRTMVVVGRGMPWKKKLMNIQSFLRTADVSSMVGQLNSGAARIASMGLDMVRIPSSMNFYPNDDYGQAAAATVYACTFWHSMVFSSGVPLVHLPQLPSISSCWDHAQCLVHVLSQYPPGTVFTCEDKDPSVMWAMSGELLLLRWLKLLISSGRWCVLNMTQNDVVKHYRALIKTSMPHFLLKDSTFGAKHIPNIYCTVKKKCYGGVAQPICIGPHVYPGGLVHTCQKQQHSCLRNIVSFRRFPCRSGFQKVFRALRSLIPVFLKTWAVETLITIKDQLQAGFDMLEPNYACKCKVCGKVMLHPTFLVADAGQAFEMLKRGSIVSNLEYLLGQAKKYNHGLLAVYKSVRSIVQKVPNLQRQFEDRVVVASNTIQSTVLAYLDFRYYQLGDIFLEQKAGAPIGGLGSGALLALVLSSREHVFMARWDQYKNEFGLAGDFHSHFCPARYEDDLGLLSKSCCFDCCKKLVDDVYGSDMTFDRSDAHEYFGGGCFYNKFVDLRISLTWGCIGFDLFHINLRFALTGDAAHLQKNRFGPPVGDRSDIIGKLASNFRSRRCRWDQIDLSIPKKKIAAYLDFSELLFLGYERRVLLAAWWKSCGYDSGFNLGLDVLHFVLANFDFRDGTPWHVPESTLVTLHAFFGYDFSALPNW